MAKSNSTSTDTSGAAHKGEGHKRGEPTEAKLL